MAADPSLMLDPHTEAFARDPYATYAQMRALGRPYHYEAVDTWMLTTMEDVRAVALNPAMVRNNHAMLSETEIQAQQRAMNWDDMPHHERFVQNNLLESEGDIHFRLRKTVLREFTAQVIERQREPIQQFVDHLLDSVSDRQQFDFIEDFAAHVPGHIIGKVLGVPDEDCPQLRIWSEEVVRFFDVGRDDNDKARAETATKEFYLYLLDFIAACRKKPADGLLSNLITHQDGGTLSEDEVIATAMLILMAGHGSTIDVLGSGMHALLRFPDQHQRLRENPSLMPLTVQEMFRFESPLPYFHRFATQDCTVGGQKFSAGTRFGLLYGAANRDPAAFDAPDAFRIDRQPNRHTAFGGGIHFCLGNHLARLDMDVIFTKLNERFAKIELAEEPEWKRGLSVRGVPALQISVHRA
ncbi:MAG: cytochrome P450 [Pseudomonadota bacterium]